MNGTGNMTDKNNIYGSNDNKGTVRRLTCGRYTEILLLLCLAVYPLRHAAMGLDLWDAGYNCGNFVNPGTEHMSSVWYFSTFLSTCLGHLFTLLPGGRTCMGINIYTGLIISAGVLMSYFFCTRKIGIGKWITAAGLLLMMSLCYSPTPIVYNHLSNVLFTAAVICVYTGLTDSKPYLLAIAGSVLGINIFVRFSNLTQAALILAVWMYVVISDGKEKNRGRTDKKKRNENERAKGTVLRDCVRYTLICMAGYAAAVLIMLFIINALYGCSNYFEGIAGLFNMDQDAEYYTFSYMFKDMIRSYLKGIHRAVYVAVFASAAYVLQTVYASRKRSSGSLADPDDKSGHRRTDIVPAVVFGLILVAVLVYRSLLQFGFHHYAVVYNSAAFLLDIIIIIAVLTVISGKAASGDRLLSLLVLLQIILTSVGSNTGISVTMNCMYLSAPYLIWKLYTLFNDVRENGKERMLAPMIVVYIATFAFILQSIMFGFTYVYQEGDNTGLRDSFVNNNMVLKGIRMSSERAELLQDMTDYINENGLTGHETIVYGFVPAIAYYLDMPTVISSWPDLASYSYSDMKKDMDRIETEAGKGEREYPVVIMGHLLETSGIAENPEKTSLINELIEDNGYVKSHENELFEIWRKTDGRKDQ